MTCYDLRFPELARELVGAGADLLVVPAAWVAGPRKVEHWRALATARAIENLAYVAAVGQPAPRYSGHSLLVDPRGEVVTEAGEGDGEVLVGEVSARVVGEAREENPSLTNRRDAEPWLEARRYAAGSVARGAATSAPRRLLPRRGREPGRGGVPEWPIGTALKAVAGSDVSRGFESRPLCRDPTDVPSGSADRHALQDRRPWW